MTFFQSEIFPSFLMFSVGIERCQWHKMGYFLLIQPITDWTWQKKKQRNLQYFNISTKRTIKLRSLKCIISNALVQRYSVKKVFLETSKNSQENTCARASFLTKLQALSIIYFIINSYLHNFIVRALVPLLTSNIP